MDLQQFDSTLKSALENIEVPFDPSTWAALESRLDALPAPDALDKALRPTLERMEPAFDPGSWSVLAQRMDGLARARRVRFTKAAEAAIFLLLLLNLEGFFGVVESVTKPAPTPKPTLGPVAHTPSGKTRKHPSAKSTTDNATIGDEGQTLTGQLLAFVENMAASLTQNNENQAIEAPTTQPLASNASVLSPAGFYGQSGPVRFQVGASLPASAVSPVQYAQNEIHIPGVQWSNPGRGKHFYGATFASFDQNTLREGTHRDRQNGFGGGMAIGYRKGKWGVETGMTYSRKNYRPERHNQELFNDPIQGIAFFYTDEVEANVLSVPVKVTRRVAKMGKTTAHAVAGVSAHFAASKNYAYKTVHYPPPNPQPNPNPVPPPSASTIAEAKGLLENGGLAYNAYASADLGIRLERSIGKRYTAFVEPVYRQSLGGSLGPKASRLNTFSLQAGVMACL